MTFGVREVSEVVSVTRKRIYVRLGEVSRPSAGTAAQSLQSVRLSLVDVSTRETAVVPEIYSLVTDTRPVPERLQLAAAVVSTPSDGYTPPDARSVTAPGSVIPSTLPEVSPAFAIREERK